MTEEWRLYDGHTPRNPVLRGQKMIFGLLEEGLT